MVGSGAPNNSNIEANVMSIAQQLVRAAQRLQRDTLRLAGVDALTRVRIQSSRQMLRLGSKYGGWLLPAGMLNRASICYLAGAGEDITFDLALLERFDCHVHTFDPTPRAIAYVSQLGIAHPNFNFHPVGLWDADEDLKFYAPKDPQHVSHSVVNLQGTQEFFEAPCRSLPSLMAQLGHTHLDLLKLDIEGAEHRVIDSMLASGIHARILCVEFDEAVLSLSAQGRERIVTTVGRLLDAGYVLAGQEGRSNYSFVKT
jgi:FkbM family methyltransferase